MSVSLTKSIGQIVLDGEDVIIWHTEGGGEYWLENNVLCLGMVLDPGRGWCHIEAGDIASVDTRQQTITLKNGKRIRAGDRSCGTFDRIRLRPLSARALQIVTNKMQTHHLQSVARSKPATDYEPTAIDAVVIAKVRRDIEENLDQNLKSPPSHSSFFAILVRDRLSISAIVRKHGWPQRTLKLRKQKLAAFLQKKYRLTLDAFLGADDSIFREAEAFLGDSRARRVRPRALAGEAEED